MAQATTTTKPATTTTPQQAAQAALQAALRASGASGLAINLAALQAGKVYTLRDLAKTVGYVPKVKKNGKMGYAPLRRQLTKAVADGKLVTAVTGGYETDNGKIAGGKAFFMLVG